MSSPIRYLLPCLLVLSSPAWTQTAASSAPPPAARAATCTDAKHHQFNFWIGEWDVTNPAGKAAGHSRIDAILDGCVIMENWTGAGGSNGKSFNIYNTALDRWEQYWVDNGGTRLMLSGNLVNGAMVLEGRQDRPDPKTGIVQRERITWTPNNDGSVRQHWENSTDNGKSWQTSFDGLYRRVTVRN
ncbi:hypothetical protein [Rhodanobacter panaciterrae]|nr:hypothetical protein [Rhodanobacter panaciterrae]